MLLAIVGGALIGLSASLYWTLNARVAGISGILSGALLQGGPERTQRWAFLSGLIAAGLVFRYFGQQLAPPMLPLLPLAAAGLLVGFGTRLGSGCTSGHGVCGLSRFSRRSLAAVLTFMVSGAITVFVVRHLLHWGGAS